MRSSNVPTKADRSPGGAPTGNVNAVKHGIYSKKISSDEERELFDSLLVRFKGDFPNADDSTLRETVLYFIRVKRAIGADGIDGLERMNNKLHKLLKKLKFSEPASGEESNRMTREEWMTGFLVRLEKRNPKA